MRDTRLSELDLEIAPELGSSNRESSDPTEWYIMGGQTVARKPHAALLAESAAYKMLKIFLAD